MGYGTKTLLKVNKEDETTPGPIYNTNEITSLAYLNRVPSKKDSSFGNKYDRWDRV